MKSKDNFDPNKPLKVLWFGGGQDSTALLLMSLHHEQFKQQYCQDNFIVVMSDTGNEFPETYFHIEKVRLFCLEKNIQFFFLTSKYGYHKKSWQTLQEHMDANNSIMSVVGKKSCTDSLKITPCYNFLNSFIGHKYQWYSRRKKGLYRYNEKFGKIEVIIGFAKGEESRIAKNENNKPDSRPLWLIRNVNYNFPLIDYGLDRIDCQEYITEYAKKDFDVPMPSNCMFCMYQSHQEVLFLYRFYPAIWQRWVIMEQNKYQRDIDRGIDPKRNLGVKGKLSLTDFLAEAQQKFGHLTKLELIQYKMSHGHCVKSKY